MHCFHHGLVIINLSRGMFNVNIVEGVSEITLISPINTLDVYESGQMVWVDIWSPVNKYTEVFYEEAVSIFYLLHEH